jgi:hypothetical protein
MVRRSGHLFVPLLKLPIVTIDFQGDLGGVAALQWLARDESGNPTHLHMC